MSDPANLHIDRGAGYTATFTYLQPDGVTPVNVTSWTATMPFDALNEERMLTAGTATGEITVTGVSGLFTLTLTGAKTSLLVVNGVYELFVTAPAAQPIRLVGGAFLVE